MLDTITEHLLDLLAADARLYRGGDAWSAGFTGALRVDEDTAPVEGTVNLFDTPLAQDSDDARPAIYTGLPGVEATDSLDFLSISFIRIEYRVINLPLVLMARAATRRKARQKRNQLRANLLYILFDHFVESGYWYEMRVPGNQGGGDARQTNWQSATGGSAQGVVEAGCIVPLTIRYSLRQGEDAA